MIRLCGIALLPILRVSSSHLILATELFRLTVYTCCYARVSFDTMIRLSALLVPLLRHLLSVCILHDMSEHICLLTVFYASATTY